MDKIAEIARKTPSEIVGRAWMRSTLWPKDEPDADKAAVKWALAVFELEEPSLSAAGAPTKSEVYMICGNHAYAVRDAMQVCAAAVRKHLNGE